MPGFFITFEGSEGCGKSTQMKLLEAALRQHPSCSSREVVVVREPGGSRIGEQIRALLQYDECGTAMVPETELLLFAASRAQLLHEVIRPALKRGAIVLCDRFCDSTTVYQGVARALRKEDVAAINHFAVGDLMPDLTILLDLEVAVGRQRMAMRNKGTAVIDRMEQEPEAFYEAVRRGYLALAKEEPKRFAVIDAAQSQDQIADEIFNKVSVICRL